MLAIEEHFQEVVSSEVRLIAEGNNRHRVRVPFYFDDGDALTIVLKSEDGLWYLSDEANTFMRLTYDVDESDLRRGTRQKVISDALSLYGIEDQEGELRAKIAEENPGDALFSFVQAILRISDVRLLAREVVRSTFREDFATLIRELVPQHRLRFDWFHPERDPQGHYPADCYINGMPEPIVVHALNSDSTTRDATIAILQYEKWRMRFRSLAIFEDQETIGRKVLARFSDVAHKQFSSIGPNRDRIADYLRMAIEA